MEAALKVLMMTIIKIAIATLASVIIIIIIKVTAAVEITRRKRISSHSMMTSLVEYILLDTIYGVNTTLTQRTSRRTFRMPMEVIAQIAIKAAQIINANQIVRAIQIIKTATIPKATIILMIIIIKMAMLNHASIPWKFSSKIEINCNPMNCIPSDEKQAHYGSFFGLDCDC